MYDTPKGYSQDTNRGAFISAVGHVHRDFCRVAIHIGKEIERVFKESGMLQKAFAEKIRTGEKKLRQTVFEKHSLDSDLLSRISEVLHYDFFALYQKKTPVRYTAESPISMSSEPPAPTRPPPIQLVINIDPDDTEMEKKVRQLMRILHPGT